MEIYGILSVLVSNCNQRANYWLTKKKPFQVRVHLPDVRQRKEMGEFHWLSKWANFIGFRETFDFARLNENFTVLFCTNNFSCGTEYMERKISSLLAGNRTSWTREKPKNESCRINLTIASAEVVFINWKIWHRLVHNKWMKKLSNDLAKKTLEYISCRA